MSEAEPPKSVRYDRQLRLWGEEGQKALENSRLCLLNVTALGTEILKNLVLPDPGVVQASDLGTNFFLDLPNLGNNKAEVAASLLRELNPHVHGKYRSELVHNNIEFFEQFTCVIATRLPEKTLLTLAAFLWEKNIPLVLAKSYGFLGSVRLAVPEHTIIQSNPDTPIEDLRIVNPFPALVEYNNSFNLPALSALDRGNVPFSVVLFQFVEKWKQEHGGNGCKTYKEKNELKKTSDFEGMVEGENGPTLLENFEEATKAHLKFAYAPPYDGSTVPSEVILHSLTGSEKVRAIMDDAKAEAKNLIKSTPKFWVLVAGLKEFVARHGVMPLSGALPDMHASNANYIALQKIFSAKAHQDMAELGEIVEQIYTSIQSPNVIDSEELKTFCKNAANLRLVRYRPLSAEYVESSRVASLVPRFDQPDDNTVWYVALRVLDAFHGQYNRFPGIADLDLDEDVSKLRQVARHLAKDLNLPEEAIKDDHLQELARYGGAELHNISAFMGGVVAQEIIKLTTHQYVPINNTFLFNGMNSSSTQLEL